MQDVVPLLVESGRGPTPLSPSRRPSEPSSLLLRLDERVNFKKLSPVYAPYLEWVVRLMLVSCFLDDSIRTATQVPQPAEQVRAEGVLPSKGAADVALGLGLLAQWAGSACLLRVRQTPGLANFATKALISWSVLQPALYGQLANFEFVADSLSVTGGLVLLRAHLAGGDRVGVGPRAQLFGRLLVPVPYVYYGGKLLVSALDLEETGSAAGYVASLGEFVVSTLLFAAMVAGVALVAAGLKSRLVALAAAVANLAFAFYLHPFFRYVWREDGKWKYDENMPMPDVTLPDGVGIADFELWEIYDLHRYYFFLGVASSGALFLLAQVGPGDIALQADEQILPTRAQD
jgi:uncharacterized membrane protein YphA (DoxX/SURF4 family)